ncbi:MAG: hypothetical protein D6722_06695, partial [Bacteroidetes bacterium]
KHPHLHKGKAGARGEFMGIRVVGTGGMLGASIRKELERSIPETGEKWSQNGEFLAVDVFLGQRR